MITMRKLPFYERLCRSAGFQACATVPAWLMALMLMTAVVLPLPAQEPAPWQPAQSAADDALGGGREPNECSAGISPSPTGAAGLDESKRSLGLFITADSADPPATMPEKSWFHFPWNPRCPV